MLETIEKPNLQDELGLLYLVGLGFVFAGLAFLWITENFLVWDLLNFVGFGLVMIDHHIKNRMAPLPIFSLLNPPQSSKVTIPYNRYYFWTGCAFGIAAIVTSPHARIFAPLATVFMIFMLLSRSNRSLS
jgi:hypothetical protein